MNKEIQELANQFTFKYYKFIEKCNELEETGKWNLEENGEMEAYFTNHLSCAAVKMIMEDKKVDWREKRALWEMFSFKFSESEGNDSFLELAEHVESLGDDDWFCDWLQEDVELLTSVDTSLAKDYKELLSLCCTITIKSDEATKAVEKCFAKKVLGAFSD